MKEKFQSAIITATQMSAVKGGSNPDPVPGEFDPPLVNGELE